MKYAVITLILTLTFISPAYCKTDSYEVDINNKFNEFYKIVNNKNLSEYGKAIDYSVEILKYKPNSLEASNIICSLFALLKSGKSKSITNTFIKYKDKYFSSIEDYNSDIAEKIILAYMMSFGYSAKNTDIADQDEIQTNAELGKAVLLKMKDNIPNENYQAIALALIADSDEYYQEFLRKYPNHPHADSIERDIIFSYFENENYEKYIEEIQKIINKYKLKEVVTPFGYSSAIDCYSCIISAYVKLKDCKMAQQYLDLIKKEAPNYWEIKSLEDEVESVKTGINQNDRMLKEIMKKKPVTNN